MKRLSTQILASLRQYNKVALPGIGIFFLKRQPARFDSAKGSIFPPFTYPAFIFTERSIDDHLLLAYCENEKISREEAWRLLNDDIETLLDTLDNTSEAELPEIGTFISEEDELKFLPSITWHTSLPVISVRAASGFPISQNPIEDAAPPEETEEIHESEERPVPHGYHYHKPGYYYIPIRKALANFAACILLAVIVGMVAMSPLGRSGCSHGTASIAPINLTDSDAVIYADEKIDSSNAPMAESLDDSIAAPSYFAIIGAMKTQKEVDKFMADHPENSRFGILHSGKHTLVSVDSASNLDELKIRLKEIRRDYPRAWIYTAKK